MTTYLRFNKAGAFSIPKDALETHGLCGTTCSKWYSVEDRLRARNYTIALRHAISIFLVGMKEVGMLPPFVVRFLGQMG